VESSPTLASPAMGHWGTCSPRLPTKIFFFSSLQSCATKCRPIEQPSPSSSLFPVTLKACEIGNEKRSKIFSFSVLSLVDREAGERHRSLPIFHNRRLRCSVSALPFVPLAPKSGNTTQPRRECSGPQKLKCYSTVCVRTKFLKQARANEKGNMKHETAFHWASKSNEYSSNEQSRCNQWRI